MFHRIRTISSSAAVAFLLVNSPALAQQDSISPEPANVPIEERKLVPPQDTPQAVQTDQSPIGQQQPRTQGREPQPYQQQQSADRYEAPPEPRSSTTERAAESTSENRDADRGSSAPAELGVYLFPHSGPGVRVGSVNPGTAADEAGLEPGDFILAINGESVAAPGEVTRLIRQMQPGETVEITIWRDGSEQPITATLGELRQVRQLDDRVYEETDVYGSAVVNRPYTTYYRAPIERRYYRYRVRPYYGGGPYYYGYPDRYYGYGRYYGTPRFGYYGSPWRSGVRVGPFGFTW